MKPFKKNKRIKLSPGQLLSEIQELFISPGQLDDKRMAADRLWCDLHNLMFIGVVSVLHDWMYNYNEET